MDILGIGYIGFESPAIEDWRRFGPEVLGMAPGAVPGGEESVYLRMDDQSYRFAIHPGKLDRLAYIGWELPGRDEYRAALARFAKAGVTVQIGDHALCDERGVREVACFRDPIGYAHEIFYAPRVYPGSFRPGRDHAGFDAGEKGAGHIVLISPVPVAETERLFQDVMGFHFLTHGVGPSGNSFLNAKLNRRSHCIAFIHVPGKMGIHHFGLPMDSLDSVGMAYDAARKRPGLLQATLGRHTQDPVISFYLFTPSGFIVECFWEDRPWELHKPANEINPPSMSLWGHENVAPPIPSTIRNVADFQ